MESLLDRLHSLFSKIGTIVRSHNPSHDLIIRDNLDWTLGKCPLTNLDVSDCPLTLGFGVSGCVPPSLFAPKKFNTLW